jgi:hypothetical protein
MRLFWALSCLVSGCFLLRFFGMTVLASWRLHLGAIFGLLTSFGYSDWVFNPCYRSIVYVAVSGVFIVFF